MPMKALDLTQGPITRTLIAFTLPTLGSNVLQSLNASVNAIWVGHFLGEAPLTATTNANMVLFLLMAAVFGVVMATGIMVGQSVGARDVMQAKRVVGSSAVFIVLLSLATAVIGALTAEPILRLMSTPPDALPYAVSYLRIVFIATPPMFFYIYAAMVLRGAGDARTPFIFMFISVGLDIALNPLLIFGAGPLPALGISGSGLAMLISQSVTLLAMIVLLYRRKHFLCIHRNELHFLRMDLAIVKVLVTRGLPMGLQMLIVSSSMLTLLGLINGYGTDTAAAFGAAVQVWTYVQMPVFAIGAAVTAMAAQNIGAGRWDRVSQATWAGVGINAAITGLLIAVVWIFNRQALSLFLPEGSAALPIAEHANVITLWSFLVVRRHDRAGQHGARHRRGDGPAAFDLRVVVGRPHPVCLRSSADVGSGCDLVELPGGLGRGHRAGRAVLPLRRLAQDSAHGRCRLKTGSAARRRRRERGSQR